ncbi:hypothetical protein BC830DRAFT_89419 [Chytriomyces sp. MP71]|nr:hypothetical protein BC830DRAFT_89419 [Chytriomyces sp. MP71]
MVNAIMVPARLKAFTHSWVVVPVPFSAKTVAVPQSLFVLVVLLTAAALPFLLFPVSVSDARMSNATASALESVEACFFGFEKCQFDYKFSPIRWDSPLLRERSKNNTKWTLSNSPQAQPRPINILYFHERSEYLEKMDRYYYDEVRAASSHGGLMVRFWGPGWFAYDDRLTATQNIIAAFPDVQFDIIYTKTIHHNVTSDTAVVIHGTGDCHNKKCITDAYYPTYADAITYRYAGLLIEFSRPEQWAAREKNRYKKFTANLSANDSAPPFTPQPLPFFFHSPDCADEAIMHPVHNAFSRHRAARMTQGERWAHTRRRTITMIGSAKTWLYPLRAKVQGAIRAGKIANASVYKHVGYVLEPREGVVTVGGGMGKGGLLGVYDAEDPDVAHHTVNQHAWAHALATTQICVFDSSVVRKAIRKYQESFMSGCVVAADIPLEMEDMFKGVVIPLSAAMSVEEINARLQEYLADKERLAWMAMEAFRRARTHWTCRNKVDRLIEAAERVVEGERGYWFPFGFSATCRKFGKDDTWITDWCKAVPS